MHSWTMTWIFCCSTYTASKSAMMLVLYQAWRRKNSRWRTINRIIILCSQPRNEYAGSHPLRFGGLMARQGTQLPLEYFLPRLSLWGSLRWRRKRRWWWWSFSNFSSSYVDSCSSWGRRTSRPKRQKNGVPGLQWVTVSARFCYFWAV